MATSRCSSCPRVTAWESRRLLPRGEGEWRRPGPHPYPVVWDFIVVIVVITGVADSILVVVLLPGVGQIGAVILGREDAYDGSVPVPFIWPEPGAGPLDAAHGPEMLCSLTASYHFSWEDKKLSTFWGDGSFYKCPVLHTCWGHQSYPAVFGRVASVFQGKRTRSGAHCPKGPSLFMSVAPGGLM